MKEKIYTSGELELALSRPIMTHVGLLPQEFQDFEPAVRATVIALRVSELGVSQLHFYAITLLAGLEVVS